MQYLELIRKAAVLIEALGRFHVHGCALYNEASRLALGEPSGFVHVVRATRLDEPHHHVRHGSPHLRVVRRFAGVPDEAHAKLERVGC